MSGGGTLAALRVLDLATDVAGQYCARLLADQGAAVTPVEPPGGHPLRARGPFDPGGRSLAFAHLAQGKRLACARAAGALLAEADPVPEPLPVGAEPGRAGSSSPSWRGGLAWSPRRRS